MKRLVYLLLFAAGLTAFAACQKGPSLDDQLLSTRRYLIAGKWLYTVKNTKVYNITTLVKDTTINFTGKNAAQAWYYIFNRDSTVFVTSLPYTKNGLPKLYTDTTARMRYIIDGENVILMDLMNHPVEQDRLVQLTGYTLEFTNTATMLGLAGWGLDVTKQYIFINDETFTKQ